MAHSFVFLNSVKQLDEKFLNYQTIILDEQERNTLPGDHTQTQNYKGQAWTSTSSELQKHNYYRKAQSEC